MLARLLVCFLATVSLHGDDARQETLWQTLAAFCQQAGLGDESCRVLDHLDEICTVDVVRPTRAGAEIRRRCVTKPSDHQAVVLHRLGLHLPSQIKPTEVW